MWVKGVTGALGRGDEQERREKGLARVPTVNTRGESSPG